MIADDDAVNGDQHSARSVPFQTGTLWQRVIETTARALDSGHLLPIPTRPQILSDGEAIFRTHVVEHLKRKRLVTPTSGNPFLPYEQEMYVSEVTPHHVALLNKFNVVDHHLLIVTSDFEPQEARLNQADFVALWSCLLEYSSLGFYNSGTESGASQPHKHLQVIPLSEGNAVTLEPLYGLCLADAQRIGKSPQLPFEHRLVRFLETDMNDVQQAAAICQRSYDGIIDQLGWRQVGPQTPYNLLVTRQWMLFVPRRQECFRSISLNAMAFAGSLLVKDEQQLQALRSGGPMQALIEVSGTLNADA